MYGDNKAFSRRHFFRSGIGLAGTLLGSLVPASVLAKMEGLSVTPRQTLGPFFPDEGDPVEEIRENLDFRLPISEANDNDLTYIQGHHNRARGQVISIQGHVVFGGVQPIEGLERFRSSSATGHLKPVPGAVLIMWNASASGRYNHRGDEENARFQHPQTGEWIEREHDPDFQYWGRAITDAEGRYWFKTILPGFYPVDIQNGWFRPPHLHFMIMAPGIPQLVTQLYFKGEAVPGNGFIQTLNAQDRILRDPKLSAEEQERLIIEYKQDPSGESGDGLVGHYDFVLTL